MRCGHASKDRGGRAAAVKQMAERLADYLNIVADERPPL